MGVNVDRQVGEATSQLRHQDAGGLWLQQTGHVLLTTEGVTREICS